LRRGTIETPSNGVSPVGRGMPARSAMVGRMSTCVVYLYGVGLGVGLRLGLGCRPVWCICMG
jgi:hypothetical protein